MKRFLLASLSTLVISAAITPVVQAEQTALNSYATGSTPATIAPSALANMARQGDLRATGIPGFQTLASEYHLGKIDAKEIAQSAVTAQVLSPDVANDPAYLNALDTQLRILLDIQ